MWQGVEVKSNQRLICLHAYWITHLLPCPSILDESRLWWTQTYLILSVLDYESHLLRATTWLGVLRHIVIGIAYRHLHHACAENCPTYLVIIKKTSCHEARRPLALAFKIQYSCFAEKISQNFPMTPILLLNIDYWPFFGRLAVPGRGWLFVMRSLCQWGGVASQWEGWLYRVAPCIVSVVKKWRPFHSLEMAKGMGKGHCKWKMKYPIFRSTTPCLAFIQSRNDHTCQPKYQMCTSARHDQIFIPM